MSDSNRTAGVCEYCGGTMVFQITAVPLDYCTEKRFEIFRCNSCKHGLTTNVTDADLKTVYEGGAYDPKEGRWHKIVRPLMNTLESAKVGYLKTHAKGKLILEIGTGKGKFLLAARKAGFNVYGIEPSTRSFGFAKQVLGDRVYHCTLEGMDQHKTLVQKYDAIFLWHVLEHLHDPAAAIRLMKTYLKPDGVIIFGVPNSGSYQAQFGNGNWYHLDPPRHLSHFTPPSANLLLSKAGMTVREIIYSSYFQNMLGDIITFNNTLLPHKNVVLNAMRRNSYYISRTTPAGRLFNLLASLLISTVVLVPMMIATVFSQWTRKAGTMVVVAQNTAGV
jgi:2-polyprenyl-3-methyl-5-hydroxy-6-metoxy-1,4-benzoquinol methylase